MPLPVKKSDAPEAPVAPPPPPSPSLHITSREVPPGGFAYKIVALAERAPREAWVGPFNDSDTLFKEVNRRERANNLPLSTLAMVEQQICERLPPGFCRDERGRTTAHPGSGALGLADVLSGTRALLRWFVHGSVEESEIIRRTYACNACPQNVPISECTGCAGAPLHALMNAIVVKPLPSDAVLQSCAVCKCSLKAKVRMHIDDVLPNMSAAQRAALPETCWLVAPVEARNDPRI